MKRVISHSRSPDRPFSSVRSRPIEPPTSLLVVSRRPFASQILDSTSCDFARCQCLPLPDHCVYLRRTRDAVSRAISFASHLANLCNHSGYFYASDPVFHDRNFLTKVRLRVFETGSTLTSQQLWYAGAYTVQTNVVPLNTGRQVPFLKSPGT